MLSFVVALAACAGNLYSREVQVDGDQVTIQVQDTPSVEVRLLIPLQTDRKENVRDHTLCENTLLQFSGRLWSPLGVFFFFFLNVHFPPQKSILWIWLVLICHLV